MAGIPLRGLNVTMIELQLIGGALVPQRMKDYIREVR